MSEIKIAPATIVDLADMAGAVSASRAQWGAIRDAAATGTTWSLRIDGELIGVAGFVSIDLADDPEFIGPRSPYRQAQAWFHFRPPAAAYMLSVVRAIRLTMNASPYRAIVTLCTSPAGKRIARASGFAFAEHSDFGEVWAHGRSSGHVDGRRGASGAKAADGGPAAHVASSAGKPAGGSRPGEL